LYKFDGKTKITNVSTGGMYETKYPARNNHDLLADFMRLEINEIIKREQARMTNIIGAIKT
jgi:hypothetical protein